MYSSLVYFLNVKIAEAYNFSGDLKSTELELEKIDKLNPESWTRENLKSELNRAISAIDLAEDEYDQAVANIQSRDSAVMNAPLATSRNPNTGRPSNFKTQFMSGLAFNLPLVLLGLLGLIAYLIK